MRITKTVVLARARSDDAEDFRNWLLTRHAPHRLAPLAERLVLQLAIPGPDGAAPLYDAVIELWSAAAPGAALMVDEALAARAILDICGSEEIVPKDERRSIATGVTPGLSQLSFTQPIAGMAREQTRRHWCEHIPLACEIHFGMNRYVQDRLTPGAEDSAPWFGNARACGPQVFHYHHALVVISSGKLNLGQTHGQLRGQFGKEAGLGLVAEFHQFAMIGKSGLDTQAIGQAAGAAGVVVIDRHHHLGAGAPQDVGDGQPGHADTGNAIGQGTLRPWGGHILRCQR